MRPERLDCGSNPCLLPTGDRLIKPSSIYMTTINVIIDELIGNCLCNYSRNMADIWHNAWHKAEFPDKAACTELIFVDLRQLPLVSHAD